MAAAVGVRAAAALIRPVEMQEEGPLRIPAVALTTAAETARAELPVPADTHPAMGKATTPLATSPGIAKTAEITQAAPVPPAAITEARAAATLAAAPEAATAAARALPVDTATATPVGAAARRAGVHLAGMDAARLPPIASSAKGTPTCHEAVPLATAATTTLMASGMWSVTSGSARRRTA